MVTLILAVALLSAPELPSGAEVVARYVEAKGGEQLLQRTETYRIVAEVRLDGIKSSECEILQARDRHLTVNTLVDGSRTSHGTNGSEAWSVDSQGGVHRITGSDLRSYLRHHTTVHESLEWPKQYASISCVGVKKIADKPAYEVHFRPEHGHDVVRFFDVASGLFVREVQQEDDEGTKTISDISDYRPVGGVLVPHKRTVSIGNRTAEYLVLRIEQNIVFPSDRFLPPESRGPGRKGE